MKHWTPEDPWEPPRRHQEMADRLSAIRERLHRQIVRAALLVALATVVVVSVLIRKG